MSKVSSPITRNANGTSTWTAAHGDKFLVTGKLRDGKKFRTETSSWQYANGINLWNGRKYLLRNGKRFLITSVSN